MNDLDAELSELFSEMVSTEVILEQEFDGSKLTVCHMQYHRSSDSDSAGKWVNQTAVTVVAKDLDFPQFTLAPQPGKLMSSILQFAVGSMGDINFDDSPEFSSSYMLQSWAEEAVRVLFTPSVRNFFEARPGWNVKAQGNRLVVFYHNKKIKSDELNDFTSEALEVISALREGESTLDENPDVERKPSQASILQATDQMGALGNLVKAQMMKIAVTRDQLEAFLNQDEPREIPSGMKRQVVGSNCVLIIVGSMFFLGGLTMGPLFFFAAKESDRFIALPFLLIFPLVGGLMVGLTMRHNRKKTRVLQSGRLVEGRITEVKATNTSINNQLRYHVMIEFELDGLSRNTKCNAYGPGAEAARGFAASGDPVRVLVDPADSSHVVCPDLLILMD